MKLISGAKCLASSVPAILAGMLSVIAFASHAEAEVKLAFASDVHSDTGRQNLSSQLDSLCSEDSCSVIGIAGDYGTNICGSEYPNAYTNTLAAAQQNRPSANVILSQGNHDYCTSGSYYNGSRLSATGPNWEVYVINVADVVGDQANFDSMASDLMTQCMGGEGSDSVSRMQKVFFVMSHVPSHTSRQLVGADGKTPLISGDEKGAIQKARLLSIYQNIYWCSQQRNIVYLWGHNHSTVAYDANVNYLVPNVVFF